MDLTAVLVSIGMPLSFTFDGIGAKVTAPIGFLAMKDILVPVFAWTVWGPRVM